MEKRPGDSASLVCGYSYTLLYALLPYFSRAGIAVDIVQGLGQPLRHAPMCARR